jgi:hypothetical protein
MTGLASVTSSRRSPVLEVPWRAIAGLRDRTIHRYPRSTSTSGGVLGVAGGLVVAGWVEGEGSKEFAAGCGDDAKVEVVNEHHAGGAGAALGVHDGADVTNST